MKLLYTLNQRPPLGLALLLAIQHFPHEIETFFHSGITTGTLVTVVLNQLLPHPPSD